MNYLVTKSHLDILDKYDGDLGLLSERWASQIDREEFTTEQPSVLGQYIDKLWFSEVDCLSVDLRARVEREIKELESHIEPEVVCILRGRVFSQRG